MDIDLDTSKDSPYQIIDGIAAAEQIYLRHDIPIVFFTGHQDMVKTHFLTTLFGIVPKSLF
jgi:hypothetical protein